jgi:hypothetical protein
MRIAAATSTRLGRDGLLPPDAGSGGSVTEDGSWAGEPTPSATIDPPGTDRHPAPRSGVITFCTGCITTENVQTRT